MARRRSAADSRHGQLVLPGCQGCCSRKAKKSPNLAVSQVLPIAPAARLGKMWKQTAKFSEHVVSSQNSCYLRCPWWRNARRVQPLAQWVPKNRQGELLLKGASCCFRKAKRWFKCVFFSIFVALAPVETFEKILNFPRTL